MASLRAWAFLALVVAGCNQAPTMSHFNLDGLAFDYPSTWNAATFDMSSSFQHWWVWLSTETMADPCDRVSTSEMISIDCERWPVASTLRENGVLLSWSSNGFPGWAFRPRSRSTLPTAIAWPSAARHKSA